MRRLLLAVVLALFSTELVAAEVAGKVSFLARRGQKPVVQETIIWLEPIDAPKAKKAAPDEFEVTTRRKTIVPHVIVVPLGSSVSFPNDDAITHNLFSVSKPNDFDLGLYKRGTAETRTFDKPGIVNVYCNVHPEMSGVIHVVSSPYYSSANKNGEYRISDVAEGKYKLVAWNEIGGTVSSEVVVSGLTVTGSTSLQIDGRKHKQESHLNKEGKPYQRQKSSDY